MRLFQNSALYPGYLVHLANLTLGCTTFDTHRNPRDFPPGNPARVVCAPSQPGADKASPHGNRI